MQAAILRVKLSLLDKWNQRRRDIAQLYNSASRELKIGTPTIAEKSYAGHLYVLQVDDRSGFRSYLEASAVKTDIHFPIPDYRQPGLAEQFACLALLSVTERICERIVTLPSFPELTSDEVNHVVGAVRSFYRMT
jgi:dTDP-4-amino-4,6-dideoxygalactose transaminase